MARRLKRQGSFLRNYDKEVKRNWLESQHFCASLPLTLQEAAIYDCALMSTRLPHHIDPIRYADAGLTLAGEVAFKRMPRLTAMISNRDGAAAIDLHFGIDEQGLRHVAGRINSEVELVCQRCLQPLLLPVTIEVQLGIVESEVAADRLPAHYDPLQVAGEPVSVGELVEDEILLALPGFPRHEAGVCESVVIIDEPPRDEGHVASKPNPFAVLASYKSKQP